MYTEQIRYCVPGTGVGISKHNVTMDKGPLGIVHLHPEIELICMTKGSLALHTENRIFSAREGDVIFINSRVPHFGETLEGGTDFIFAQLLVSEQAADPFRYLAGYLSKAHPACVVFSKGEEGAGYLTEKLMELLTISQEMFRAAQYMILAEKYHILAFLYQKKLLADVEERFERMNAEAIRPVLEYINDNYSGSVSLAQCSEKLNLHRNYLCRLFKKNTGLTVVDYLNFVRICHAEELLKAGLSISETAEKTGFSSQAYFHKVFRKYLFLSPSEYRRQYRFVGSFSEHVRDK